MNVLSKRLVSCLLCICIAQIHAEPISTGFMRSTWQFLSMHIVQPLRSCMQGPVTRFIVSSRSKTAIRAAGIGAACIAGFYAMRSIIRHFKHTAQLQDLKQVVDQQKIKLDEHALAAPKIEERAALVGQQLEQAQAQAHSKQLEKKLAELDTQLHQELEQKQALETRLRDAQQINVVQSSVTEQHIQQLQVQIHDLEEQLKRVTTQKLEQLTQELEATRASKETHKANAIRLAQDKVALLHDISERSKQVHSTLKNFIDELAISLKQVILQAKEDSRDSRSTIATLRVSAEALAKTITPSQPQPTDQAPPLPARPTQKPSVQKKEQASSKEKKQASRTTDAPKPLIMHEDGQDATTAHPRTELFKQIRNPDKQLKHVEKQDGDHGTNKTSSDPATNPVAAMVKAYEASKKCGSKPKPGDEIPEAPWALTQSTLKEIHETIDQQIQAQQPSVKQTAARPNRSTFQAMTTEVTRSTQLTDEEKEVKYEEDVKEEERRREKIRKAMQGSYIDSSFLPMADEQELSAQKYPSDK